MLRRFFVHLILFATLLAAGSVSSYAQQKKPAAQKKPATSVQKKSTTSTAKKATSQQTKKTTTQQTKKPAGKSQQTKTTSAPAKKLSRAEYEKQQKDLQKQIAATERMISDNDKSVLSQSRDIKLREDEIGKRKALLVAMMQEVEAIRQEEDSLSQVIARLKKEYKGKQDKYAAAVKHLYKWRSGYDEWMFIISAADVTESFRRMRYLRQYGSWREQEAHALARQRMATESVQEKLALVRQDREQVLENVKKERDLLARKQKLQEEALANLKQRQKELKTALAADKKKQAEIQRQITKLIEQERKAAQQANKKGSSSASGSSAAKPGVYSPQEVQQLTGSFRQNKGKMPYPVDSNYSILTHYTRDGNYSITLSTAVGAHACAVFEGAVSKVVRTSEDWTVIINHGDYMSVYSGLSVCHVKEGQKVKMRQSIGVIKSDIDGKRAELMFWIYGKSDAENPELWLRK